MLQTPTLIAIVLFATAFAGCASSRHWKESQSNRERAVVQLSYEFPEFHEPVLSDDQATRLALSRCEGWGYDKAEPIAGQLRQCSNMNNGDCDLWKVTREYQCTSSVSQANLLSR